MWARLRYLGPTLLRLGPANLARVAFYRTQLRAGWFARTMPRGDAIAGPFLGGGKAPPAPQGYDLRPLGAAAEELHTGRLVYFSHRSFALGNPPDWFLNPYNGQRCRAPHLHWSRLPDFDPDLGDIKCIWEPARFDWVVTLACAYRLTREPRHLALLNAWIEDWLAHNPPNIGPNWKCGQEASIRLLHLLLAAHILGELDAPQPGLLRLVAVHAARIMPSLSYAIGQDNNHGTSEAAALFVAGAWLHHHAGDAALRQAGARWQAKGRALLAERVARLVLPDGTFSQYSTNYQRLFLDTLALAELFRRLLALPPFPAGMSERAIAAIDWLAAMVEPASGDAPNLGANDGARLFAFSSTPYRDFRPSVALASVLFKGSSPYSAGPWDDVADWLGVASAPRAEGSAGSRLFPDGGFVLLASRDGRARVWLRLPRFRFRPGHADALHLDFWLDGANLLRDGGSYSYADTAAGHALAAGRGHNTVEFDGRPQMPRLSRFLFGAWLTGEVEADLERGHVVAAYVDAFGARHRRTVHLADRRLTVIDETDGRYGTALLSWRLAPERSWRIEGQTCYGEGVRLAVSGGAPPQLETTVESRHYLELTELPVMTVTLRDCPGRIVTAIDWSD